MIKPKQVVELRIVLSGVMPPVTRRVVVAMSVRLSKLHQIIQAAMGWTNSHLYCFTFSGTGFGIPTGYDDPGDMIDARTVTLYSALEDSGARSFSYIYDFGDNWEHAIKIGRIETSVATTPFLIDASGACPPEDCGGAWAYNSIREALSDPSHKQYANMVEMFGEDFLESRVLDVKALTRAVEKLAPRPRVKRR